MVFDIKQNTMVSVCDHPIAKHNLSIMRNKETSAELFRNATRRLAEVLFFNATDNLPTVKTKFETPLVTAEEEMLDENAEIIIAPILRAGLVISEVASQLLPNARVHHIGLYRDEQTLEPVSYYNNLPKKLEHPSGTFVYLVDPMLATGGSAVAGAKLFLNYGVPQENIRFVCLLSVPEGISKLHSEFPNIKIITACIDKQLNEKGYILPGLGDAGDRSFNTTY